MTRTPRRFPTALLAGLTAALLLSVALTWAAPPPGKGGGNGNGGGGDGGGDNSGAAYPIDYSITLLGTLGGEMSTPSGMNNHSDVVGRSDTSRAYSFINPETSQLIEGFWRHGFLYADLGGGAQMHDLQDLFEAEGVISPFDYAGIEGWYVQQAYDINDVGQMIGRMSHIEWIDVPGGSRPIGTGSMLFRYTPAGEGPALLEEFTGLPGWMSFSIKAINNFGEVCGHAHAADNLDHLVVWSQPGAPTDLGLFPGRDTWGIDLNDVGQVCGIHQLSYRAWRHTPGSGFENLGVGFKKKNASSSARGINNDGQVAGTSSDGQWTSEAFRYTDGEGLKRLGTLGGNSSHCSQTGAINSAGDVVGLSQTSSGVNHVFLYTDEYGMADLQAAVVNFPADLEGQIDDVVLPVNDAGVVCGRAGDGSGTQPSLVGHTFEAFVLTPLP